MASCCKKQKKAPTTKHQEYASFIYIDSMNFDLGTVKKNGGTIKHTFNIKNKSNDTVIISHIQKGCGCISVLYPQKTIMPNSTIPVTILFNPAKRHGSFRKPLFILFNDGEFYITPAIYGYVE